MNLKLLWIALIGIGAGFALGWIFPGPLAPRTGEEDSPTATDARTVAPPGWDDRFGTLPRFTDVTEASGIAFRHENGHRPDECRYLEIMGAGVGLFDYDRDGDLDVYLVNGNLLFEEASPKIKNALYRNDGGWRFTDVTEQAKVGDAGFGQGCCAGDYDGDGDLDLYVTNYGPNVLYRNEGDGTFTDVSETSGLADAGWGQSCSFFDYDSDGALDLYVENYLTFTEEDVEPTYIWIGGEKVVDYPSPLGFRGAPDRIYRNLADGTFLDVTKESGLLKPEGKGMGIACVDLDDDGFDDVFVANDTQENFLFFGSENGEFSEMGLAAGVAFNDTGIPEASMGVDVADADADGHLDLIVPCLHRQVYTLYRNLGNRLFADVSVAAGLAQATSEATGFNANFLDYDNDGDVDIFFTAGGVRRNELAPPRASYNERYGVPDILVANDGAGRFIDVSAAAGSWFRERRIGRGSAVGDLDGDGDLDLVVSNLADRAALLRNDTPAQGHWLIIELVTADGRIQPFGADVRVATRERTQRQVTHGRVSYLSQSDRRLHFGLGTSTAVDRLEITWPDGQREEHEDVAADRHLRVVQGKPLEAAATKRGDH